MPLLPCLGAIFAAFLILIDYLILLILLCRRALLCHYFSFRHFRWYIFIFTPLFSLLFLRFSSDAIFFATPSLFSPLFSIITPLIDYFDMPLIIDYFFDAFDAASFLDIMMPRHAAADYFLFSRFHFRLFSHALFLMPCRFAAIASDVITDAADAFWCRLMMIFLFDFSCWWCADYFHDRYYERRFYFLFFLFRAFAAPRHFFLHAFIDCIAFDYFLSPFSSAWHLSPLMFFSAFISIIFITLIIFAFIFWYFSLLLLLFSAAARLADDCFHYAFLLLPLFAFFCHIIDYFLSAAAAADAFTLLRWCYFLRCHYCCWCWLLSCRRLRWLRHWLLPLISLLFWRADRSLLL